MKLKYIIHWALIALCVIVSVYVWRHAPPSPSSVSQLTKEDIYVIKLGATLPIVVGLYVVGCALILGIPKIVRLAKEIRADQERARRALESLGKE